MLGVIAGFDLEFQFLMALMSGLNFKGLACDFNAKSMRIVPDLLAVLRSCIRNRTESELHCWKGHAKLYELFCYRRGGGEG